MKRKRKPKFEKTKPIWKPGDAVVLWSSSDRPSCRKEYGRVIDLVWEPRWGWWRVWVAFFGFKWPTERMLRTQKPYVLNYLETSLLPYPQRSGTFAEQAQAHRRSVERAGTFAALAEANKHGEDFEDENTP